MLKYYLILSSILCAIQKCVAQQAQPLDYKLLALHIIDEQSKEIIPDLRITLCQYSGKMFHVVYQKNDSSKLSTATFKQIQHARFSFDYDLTQTQEERISNCLKNDYGLLLPNRSVGMHSYYRMQDQIGIVHHTEESWQKYLTYESYKKTKSPKSYQIQAHSETPLIKVVIDDIDGDKNGSYPSREFILPQSMFYQLSDTTQTNKTITITLSPNRFIPIDQSMYTSYIIQHITSNTKIERPWSAFEEIFLKQIDIINEQNGKVLQRIDANDLNSITKKWRTTSLLSSENKAPIRKEKLPNFLVEFDENESIYFTFNNSTEQYTHESKMSERIQLVDESSNKEPVYTKPHLQCLRTNTKLPVLFFAHGQKQLVFKDTFWIINPTDRDISIFMNPMYHKNWTLDSVIKARGQSPLVYTRIFDTITGPYEMINEYANIRYNANQTNLAISVYGQVINPKAKVTKLKDGSLNFTIPVDDQMHYVVNTFPNGILKEDGHKRNSDSAKIGSWTKKARFGDGYDVEHHSIELKFQLKNADYKQCKFYYKQMWVAGEFEFFPTENLFSLSLPMAASEIIIRSDSACINYLLQKGEDKITGLYLLKPNESYIYWKGIKRPVDYKHQQYAIIWKNQIEPNKMSSIILTLKSKYPTLNVKQQKLKTTIDATLLSSEDKDSMLQDFIKNDDITCIAKLTGKDDSLLFTNRIFTNTEIALNQIQLKQDLAQYGFSYIENTTMNKLRHYFEYKSKLMDEQAIEQFNLLVEAFKWYNFNLEGIQ